MSDALSISIIDDDVNIRMKLKDIISSNNMGEIVFEGKSGTCLDSLLFDYKQIDVIFLDFIMLISGGLEAIEKLKQMDYRGKIVMLSQDQGEECISKAYRVGIDYYITKPIIAVEVESILETIIERKQLINIVRSLSVLLNLNGNISLDKSNSILIEEVKHLRLIERKYHINILRNKLTPSEIKILELISEGFTQSEIAETLFLSVKTVKNHITNMLKKTSLTSSKKLAEKIKF